jgi:hypothetical protein
MTAKLTITEALSEINLINKKIDDKSSAITPALILAAHAKDPYTDHGAYVASELQAINDLQKRLVRIRSAVQRANLDNTITIGEETKSIAEWLSWKKEVAEKAIGLFNRIRSEVTKHLTQNQSRPSVIQVQEGANVVSKIVEFKYAVDLQDMAKRSEVLSSMFENLDGQLSLKNATIAVTI